MFGELLKTLRIRSKRDVGGGGRKPRLTNGEAVPKGYDLRRFFTLTSQEALGLLIPRRCVRKTKKCGLR